MAQAPVSERRILWLSSGYGKDGDLQYFEAIFRGVSQIWPQTEIFVDVDFPVERYPDLGLVPKLRFRNLVLGRARRQAKGGYQRILPVPSFSTIKDVILRRANAYVAIEFTPISVCALILATIRRRPVLHLIESDPAFRGGIDSGWLLRIKGRLARLATLTMTNNSAGRAFATTALRIDPDRVLARPYLTSSIVTPKPMATTKTTNFLFANSLTERKGIRVLLRALWLIDIEAARSIKVTVVGGGELLAEVQDEAVKLAGRVQVDVIGPLQYAALARYFVDAHVVVNPTMGDYRSLCGFEAVNAGRVLLNSRMDGAAAEVVEVGVNGYVFSPEKPEELAELIVRLADNRALVERLGAGSVKLAATFSTEVAVKNISDALAMVF